MTWIFGTGPRQTVSMDGTFSKGPGAQKQRILNATAIFDELHDFEGNTRGTSGGLGALTTGDCTALASEVRQVLPGGVAAPAKALETTAGSCRASDWDDIGAWVKTIRPPKGLQRLNPDQVTHGRQIFTDEGTGVSSGNCTKCHAGPGWTVSRRFYTPSADNATTLANLDFSAGSPWPALWNQQTKAIQTEQPSGVGPAHVSCVLRNLATVSAANSFGPTALEKKPDGSPAQGANGYNVPSLYGLALNAPYLHSGVATTLRDLLDSFPGHLTAGNDNFAPTGDEKDALVAFLLTIDAATAEVPVTSGFDKCVDLP